MRLGGRHAGVARQVFQRHRPPMVRQCMQQLAADLHALDAALRAALLGGLAVSFVHETN